MTGVVRTMNAAVSSARLDSVSENQWMGSLEDLLQKNDDIEDNAAIDIVQVDGLVDKPTKAHTASTEWS
jgi:hypothetical protein